VTSLRVLAGVAAGIALAAFALGSARLGALSEPPAPAPAAAPVFPALAPPPAPVAAEASAPAATPPRGGASLPPAARASAPRPHVSAGVLVRAASARKQERAATCPAPARPAPGDGGVESIEIDWNAPPPPEP
jgi:hypothetical protein